MKSITRVLLEHFVNIHDTHTMEEYKDEVWELLQTAYTGIGGYKGATSADHLIDKTDFWKAVQRDGKLVAVVVYKVNGNPIRKSIGIGHDGTRQGKRDAVGIMKADILHDRAWAEVSGRAETLRLELGATMLPNQYADILVNKSIIDYNDDGYHYTRLINGEPMEKVIMGPELIIDALDTPL